MEIRDLRTLVAVLEAGSFEAGARVLNITSAAVAHRISKLEEDVGQLLVVRTTPSRPTAAGSDVLRLARSVEQIVQEAETEFANGATLRPLSIAVNFASLATWFPGVIEHYMKLSGQTLHCIGIDEESTADLLREGRVDCALAPTPRAAPGCIARDVGLMRYVAAAPVGMTDAVLSGRIPNLRYARKDTTTDHFLDRLGLHSNKDTWVPDVTVMCEMVRSGYGWAVLPEMTVKKDVAQDRMEVVMPELFFDLPIRIHGYKNSSTRLQQLIQACRSVGKQFLRAI